MVYSTRARDPISDGLGRLLGKLFRLTEDEHKAAVEIDDRIESWANRRFGITFARPAGSMMWVWWSIVILGLISYIVYKLSS